MLIFGNLNLDSVGTGPIIGTLNADNTLSHGQACTLAGAQFTVTEGTLTLRKGALEVVQTVTAWTDTSIEFTADTAIFPYGPIVLEVVNADGTAQANVTLIPTATKGYIDIDVPWPANSYSVLSLASPAAVDGDQLEYDLTTNNGATVTMFADGTFTLNNATQSHIFYVRAFDQTDQTWSAAAAISVVPTSLISIITPVDNDGSVTQGQVGAIIQGWNFGTVAGSVSIGGASQTVTSWADTLIIIDVAAATPLGSQTLAISSPTAAGAATVNVVAAALTAPSFIGPSIGAIALNQNTPMTQVAVAARFSDPQGQPMTFTALGAWPDGVIVTAVNGTIQGTPTVPGTYSGLRVRATDPDGNYGDSNSFAITVAAAVLSPPVFIGPVISIADLTATVAMTSVQVASRFFDPEGQTLTYSARGTWPPGITVSTATGAIQGTPSTVGSYTALAIRATDTDGLTADSNTFAIVVVAAGGVVTPSPTPGAPGEGADLSDVAIANRALTKLGEARIISFGDDTKAARAIASLYYFVRDAELRRRKWRFSLKRTELPALADSPEFGYAYAYQLPADCLAILSVGDIAPGVDMADYRTGFDSELYAVEGRTVLTDLGAPLKLRYKARVTDPTQFDLAFTEALAARLAYELAEDLTQSAAKKEAAGADYKFALREAVQANAIEVAPTTLNDDSWLLSRQ